MLCSNCFQSEYKTIKRLIWIAPGCYESVDAEFCPNCGDTVYTHEQSLKIDELRRSHKQPKLKYVLEVIE